MMFHTYILKSKKDNSFYIGFAPDLKKRISKHHLGQVKSTKNLRPVELIYYEAYKAKEDALIREKQLKRFVKGFSQLKGRIRFSLLDV